MAGTGDNHTSSGRSAGPPEELPFDSPNWITIEAAYRELRGAPRYVGYLSLAATDLDAAVCNGRVPAMRKCFLYDRNRKLIGLERERLELAHWDERRLSVRADGSLEVVEGAFRSRVRGPILIYSVKGYAYFVWKPALAKVWPDVFASTPSTPVPTPPSPTLTVDPAATTPTLAAEELQGERSAVVQDAILPSAPVKRLGKQERRLESIAFEIYGESMPILLASEFQRVIELALKNKTLTTPLPPHWVPGLSACRRFLAKRNKLRAVH
jgi:hypothetical protein